MAKAKSFAEKMLKNLKPKDEFTVVRVIKPRVSAKGALKFDDRVYRIRKDQNEAETLGI